MSLDAWSLSPNHIAQTLLPNRLRLPPPIIRIRIKHEGILCRKCHIKDMPHDQENNECQPLKPGGRTGAFVVGGECNEA